MDLLAVRGSVPRTLKPRRSAHRSFEPIVNCCGQSHGVRPSAGWLMPACRRRTPAESRANIGCAPSRSRPSAQSVAQPEGGVRTLPGTAARDVEHWLTQGQAAAHEASRVVW